MERLLRELDNVLDSRQILQNEPLGRHTTFRVGGPADLYLMPGFSQLSALMEILRRHKAAVTVIGNGSNLLVGDRGIRGVVIEIGRQMSEVFVQDDRMVAQAGALLSKAAQEAYKNGLSGMEFASGIPGSVGGAVVMNAGAYGGEIKDIASVVTVLEKDGGIRKLTNDEMEFSYRHSCAIEREYLILEAEFLLKKADPADIRRNMDELKEKRLLKQPLEYPSAGSTFKRPEGYFAGKLIMDAGLAGFYVGGAEVSQKHCGFVINKGGASAADILSVIRHVQKTVKERFGVELKPEVKLLGEF